MSIVGQPLACRALFNLSARSRTFFDSPVARHLAAAGEIEEVVGTIPALDHVEPFLDFSPQGQAVQVVGKEDRLHCTAQLGERLVGWMLNIVAGGPAQNGLGLGRAEPQRRRILGCRLLSRR